MTRLLYFADPMCSWCWGFSPVIGRIADRYADRASITLIVGGLRIGPSPPLTGALKEAIRHHWEQVHAASGQPFDFTFFDRDDFAYDTEPACRAVVTARVLRPDAALPMLAALHRAFYAEGRDVTTAETLVEVAVEQGLDATTFSETLEAPETRKLTRGDFVASRQLGVHGYPTLLGARNHELVPIAMGYRPFDEVAPALEDWLDARRAPSP